MKKDSGKSKELEKKYRIGEVVKRIRKGWSCSKIIEWVMENWDLSRTSSYRIVNDAYEMLAENADKVIESSKVIQVERLEDLLRSSIESNDRQTAVKTLDMLNKIYQLYVQKNEIKIDGSSLKFSFGDDDNGEESV